MKNEKYNRQDIKYVYDELIAKLKVLRAIHKGSSYNDLFGDKVADDKEEYKDSREEILEATIKDVILKLEETKRSFKSKKIKEIREKLIDVLGE